MGLSNIISSIFGNNDDTSSGSSDPNVVTTTTTGTTIPSLVSGATITLPNPLTQEEINELEELEKDRRQAHKLAKLEYFKKLPSELRQFVINSILWREALATINTMAEPEKSARMLDLERRKMFGPLVGGIGTGQYFWSNGSGILPVNLDGQLEAYTPLPNDILVEELKQAHLEATLEEQMLKDDV